MNVLELHAGSRSIGKIAEGLNHNVFSVDWKNFENIDLCIDIENLKISDIPFIPDMVWTSPDCTTYTISAISTHRNGVYPKSEYAEKCDRLNIHQIELINTWLKINPSLLFYIENPRGMLRKMPFMKDFHRVTVWYCAYGDSRAKPTDIFTNDFYWKPLPICFNGNRNCHHEAAPRGSKTGTQGKKGSYERSKIPEKLCKEIILSAQEFILKTQLGDLY